MPQIYTCRLCDVRCTATSCKLAAQELWWETFGEPLPADGAMWRGPPPPAWASGPPPAPGAKLCLRAHRTRSRRVGRNIRLGLKTRNAHATEISVRYCPLSCLYSFSVSLRGADLRVDVSFSSLNIGA